LTDWSITFKTYLLTYVTIPVEQPIHEENVRDKDDNLQTETVEEKLKTGTDEGSSISKDEGTCRPLWQSS